MSFQFQEGAEGTSDRRFTYMRANRTFLDLLKSRGIETELLDDDPVVGGIGMCILGKAYPLNGKLVYMVNWFYVGEFAAIPESVVKSMIDETPEHMRH